MSESVGLPPECYTSSSFHEFELEAVWSREWFCVGRADQIPNPGDYYTLTVGNDPLIVVRDHDAVVRVMSAVCRHRGMIIADGSGNTKQFRCPYHSWAYDTTGQLVAAPEIRQQDYFDMTQIHLPNVRVELWLGFIFVNFDDRARALAERLQSLTPWLENYQLSEMRMPEPLSLSNYDWNWKQMGDECYHCSQLHATSWHKMFPTPTSRVDWKTPPNEWEKGIISYSLIGRFVDASPTPSGRILYPPIPTLTEEQRSRLHYVTIAPNIILTAMPDKVKFFIWFPLGPERCSFGIGWMFPQATMALPDFRDTFEEDRDLLAEVAAEDIWAWGTVQSGMRSRFAPRGQLAPSEENLVRLNRWLVSKYEAVAE